MERRTGLIGFLMAVMIFISVLEVTSYTDSTITMRQVMDREIPANVLEVTPSNQYPVMFLRIVFIRIGTYILTTMFLLMMTDLFIQVSQPMFRTLAHVLIYISVTFSVVATLFLLVQRIAASTEDTFILMWWMSFVSDYLYNIIVMLFVLLVIAAVYQNKQLPTPIPQVFGMLTLLTLAAEFASLDPAAPPIFQGLTFVMRGSLAVLISSYLLIISYRRA
jgi:hypothetical protein